MKREKILQVFYWILMVFPVGLAALMMLFFPKTVPGHFGVSGEATKWMGKSVLLIYPGLSLILGMIMGAFSIHAKSPQNKKIWFWSGIAVMSTCLVLFVCYICRVAALI